MKKKPERVVLGMGYLEGIDQLFFYKNKTELGGTCVSLKKQVLVFDEKIRLIAEVLE